MLAFLNKLILIILLLFISIEDIKTKTIPINLIILGIVSSFIIALIQCFIQNDISFITTFIFGVLAGAIPVFLIIFITNGGMGGGDLKLMAMIGGFLGWVPTIIIFLLSIILGGIFGIVLMLTKNKPANNEIPFAPFISMATLILILFQDNIYQLIKVLYGIKLQ